jgi:hypothetical protein
MMILQSVLFYDPLSLWQLDSLTERKSFNGAKVGFGLFSWATSTPFCQATGTGTATATATATAATITTIDGCQSCEQMIHDSCHAEGSHSPEI